MNVSRTGTQVPSHAARSLRVFLSYRKDDAARAEDLRRAAERFEDIELCSFPYGQAHERDWRETFVELIASADGLVCLVGPTTSESANIAWELAEAARRKIPIVLHGPGSDALAAAVDAEVDALDDMTSAHVLSRLRAIA